MEAFTYTTGIFFKHEMISSRHSIGSLDDKMMCSLNKILQKTSNNNK